MITSSVEDRSMGDFKKTGLHNHRARGLAVLLTIGLCVALYSQWTDGGAWKITALIAIAMLVSGYAIGLLRSRGNNEKTSHE